MLGCVEDRSLFVPNTYGGERARGGLLVVERGDQQTMVALDLENEGDRSSVIEPYEAGDRTNLYLYRSTPAELFWATGLIPTADEVQRPVPQPLLAQLCGQVEGPELSLGDCSPDLLLTPRLRQPDAVGCLQAGRCVVGADEQARCLPCEAPTITAPQPPAPPQPRMGPCPAGWEASGPLALCRPTWSSAEACTTFYSMESGCAPQLRTCPTSSVALIPGQDWQGAISGAQPGPVFLGEGRFQASGPLQLPPGRQVIGACGRTVLELPDGAELSATGSARTLRDLTVRTALPIRVERGQTLRIAGADLRPAEGQPTLDVQSATVALSNVTYAGAPRSTLIHGSGGFARIEGLSAVGGAVLVAVAASTVVARGMIAGEMDQVFLADQARVSLREAHVFAVNTVVRQTGGSVALTDISVARSRVALAASSTVTVSVDGLLFEAPLETVESAIFLTGVRGSIRHADAAATLGVSFDFHEEAPTVEDIVARDARLGFSLGDNGPPMHVRRILIEGTTSALTVNHGATLRLEDLTVRTRCEGFSSISLSDVEVDRADLTLVEGGGPCSNEPTGVAVDREAEVVFRDLRVTGAQRALWASGGGDSSPTLTVERAELRDNASDVTAIDGTIEVTQVTTGGCERWPTCGAVTLSPRLNQAPAVGLRRFAIRDRAQVFLVDGGELTAATGAVEQCPGYVLFAGTKLPLLPELSYPELKLLSCEGR